MAMEVPCSWAAVCPLLSSVQKDFDNTVIQEAWLDCDTFQVC